HREPRPGGSSRGGTPTGRGDALEPHDSRSELLADRGCHLVVATGEEVIRSRYRGDVRFRGGSERLQAVRRTVLVAIADDHRERRKVVDERPVAEGERWSDGDHPAHVVDVAGGASTPPGSESASHDGERASR